jgi:predicted DsbA family dithiol-disulfide isomerase
MLTIVIYSDVICPGCWIGKRWLERGHALAGRTGTVRWHPFVVGVRDHRLRPLGVRREWTIRMAIRVGQSRELDPERRVADFVLWRNSHRHDCETLAVRHH